MNIILDNIIKLFKVFHDYLDMLIQFNYCVDENIFINFFKELLFLDFKKPVIMIYIDSIISETFIINALINLDFQNSIIIELQVFMDTKKNH